MVVEVGARLGKQVTLRQVFECPQIRALAGQLESADVGAAPIEAIEPTGRGETVASTTQQRFHLLAELAAGLGVYNIPVCIRIRNELSIDALRRALTRIVDRHDLLRSRFVSEHGNLRRQTVAGMVVEMPLHDLTGCVGSERDNRIRALLTQESSRSFDRAAGPLVRVCLIKLADEDLLLSLVFDHTVFDGWSVGVLQEELTAAYGVEVAGLPEPPPLPIQYGDYAEWEARRIAEPEVQHELEYWLRQLSGDLPLLELPTDVVRPAVPTGVGASFLFRFDPSLNARVAAVARQADATPFMVVLAAYQVLLQGYTGQNEVVIGTPASVRVGAAEGLIGPFVNTLALRLSGDRELPFAELLASVRETCLDAFDHKRVPFEQVLKGLERKRATGRTPVFQTIFSLDDTRTSDRFPMHGLDCEFESVDLHVSRTDLTMWLDQRDEGIGGLVEYDATLFEESFIARMVASFELILSAIADDPSQRIGALPLLSRNRSSRSASSTGGRTSSRRCCGSAASSSTSPSGSSSAARPTSSSRCWAS
jgi:non-ribosomal peptide synthetase component F